MILTRTNFGSEGVNPKSVSQTFSELLAHVRQNKEKKFPWRNSFDCTLMDHISNDHLQCL